MLEAYRKEWTQFPREQKIQLGCRMAQLVAYELGRRFDIYSLHVDMTNRSSGHAWSNRIALPYKGCSLGMIIHELAHVYNYQKYRKHGHTGTFKNALSLIYHHSRPMMKEILLKAKATIEQEQRVFQEESRKMAIKIQSKMEREKKDKELKASRSYRIRHIEERIKNLESRKKRIETIIKSAKRSLVHLRRYESLSQQKQTPITENAKEA